jgi:catechol 2,3-dioxygenase-like lactoylglutathione lyase family enzyme
MSATRVNHVSVHAPDLETSVARYEDLFGARRIPTPNFGMPVTTATPSAILRAAR